MDDYFDGVLNDAGNGYLGLTSDECDAFCSKAAWENDGPVCCAKAEYYIFEADMWALDCGVAKTDQLMPMEADYAMDYTVWADYYAYIVQTSSDADWSNATNATYGDYYDYGDWDYYYGEDWDDYYYDDYADYEWLYSYAPWDWGMSENWNDNYMCADEANGWNNYVDMIETFTYRDECIDWCYSVQAEMGGTCCGSAVIFDSYSYESYVACAVYDTEPGEYDYLPEEMSESMAAWYGAFEIPSYETGPWEKAQGWIEDTFGNSASKVLITMSALVADRKSVV